jgi:hypothetical protein
MLQTVLSEFNMIQTRTYSPSSSRYVWLICRSPQQLERDFNTTGKNIGLPYATDLTCGNPAGLGPIANTRSGNLRIDACESYFVM